MENLIENALKFTNAGNTIQLTMKPDEDDVLITVSDTGIGIPSEDLPQLFGRFHRGHNTLHLPGSGLELAIVKAIVDAHGGNVEVQSEGLGKGSKFLLRLHAVPHPN